MPQQSSLAAKLQLKPGTQVHPVNVPQGYDYAALLGESGVEVVTEGSGPFDAVHLWVTKKAEVDEQAAQAIALVKPGGLLWLSYPKKSGKIKTDINRDSGWEAVHGAGWEGVRLISIDDTWSAMRCRPLAEIPKLTRKFGPNAKKEAE